MKTNADMQPSIIRREVLIWSIFQEWAEAFPQNAESLVILCFSERKKWLMGAGMGVGGSNNSVTWYLWSAYLLFLFQWFLQFSNFISTGFLMFRYHAFLFLPWYRPITEWVELYFTRRKKELSCAVLTRLFISHTQPFLVFLEFGNSICQTALTNK